MTVDATEVHEARQKIQDMLTQFHSRELMDALMAADLPLGGTDTERIERLLSVVHPQNVWQFIPKEARQRVLQG